MSRKAKQDRQDSINWFHFILAITLLLGGPMFAFGFGARGDMPVAVLSALAGLLGVFLYVRLFRSPRPPEGG